MFRNWFFSVTEKDRDLSWIQRKKDVLEEIKNFSNDSLLVKSADVISNLSELTADYDKEGDKTFNRFKASKEEVVGHYAKVARVIIESWQENPLKQDLRNFLDRLKKI